jgi:hypothetical protein
LEERLARIKTLLDELERQCADAAENREVFLRLRQELDATHRQLKLLR